MSWMDFLGRVVQLAFMLYELCGVFESYVSTGIIRSTTFAHSSHASTGTRCCIFKMTSPTSTYTSCCQGHKPFGPMRCGVGSSTFTSRHCAGHTRGPIGACLLIEIEAEGH